MTRSITSHRGGPQTRRVEAGNLRAGVPAMRLTVCATMLCLLGSCATYYEPNAHNVPLFQHQGEARVTAGMNEGSAGLGHTDGTDFQGAYAITNHVGVMANVFCAGGTDDMTGDTGKGRLVEGGAGYYRPVTDHWVFETYAGAGLGLLTRSTGFGQMSVNVRRAFLQPSFGFASRGFDAALSLRVCGLTYSGIPERSIDDEGAYMVQELREARSSMLAEPALTVRVGWESVKLQFQVGLSENLTHPEFAQGDRYASLGACVTGKNRRQTASAPEPTEADR
jgi:hypothetical protein